jgi:threonine/homoserine/homoserine lactone efflux protein
MGGMSWETWAAFTITETVLCLTPGPAVLFVLAQGLGRGTRAALAAATGILAGNSLYFIVSATSLGGLLLASYEVFSAIKWAGAAYLIWLGVRTLRSPAGLRGTPEPASDADAGRLVGRGFLVQVANPKALVFFGALLPQFIDPHRSVVGQMIILGTTSLVVELAVLATYGTLAARAAHLVARPGFLETTNRVAGTLLIGAGLRMAALRRGQ